MQIYDDRYRKTILCIDQYDHGVLKGRMYNPYLDGGVSFQSAIELLKNMDTMLDKMNYPQSFSGKRVFWESPEAVPTANIGGEVQSGKMATFAVNILFRQNASWQGSLAWYEGKREESFRSVLELLLLIDSALEHQKA